MITIDFLYTVLGTPLGYIMWVCYLLVNNFGLAIIIFTFIVKAAMFPLNIKQQKKVVVMSGHGVIGTKGSLFSDICKYAQVDNCMEQLQTGQNTTVSKEFIVQCNPDVIIMPGWNGASTHTLETEKELLNDQSLQSVKAIQNKNLVTLSGQDMYCVSQYVADSVLAIDKLVYPEYFK